MSDTVTKIAPNSIKFEYNGEIRKLTAITNYLEMNDTIQQAYGFEPNTFTIKYKDEDDDMITVSSQDDYVLALEHFGGKPPKFTITCSFLGSSTISVISKIDDCDLSTITKNEPSLMTLETGESHSIDQNFIKSDFPKLENTKEEIEESKEVNVKDYIEKHVDAIMQAPKVPLEDSKLEESKESHAHHSEIHLRVACDICNWSPIVGTRYKCTVCFNFDLCENCESSNDHNHPLMKLKTSKDFDKFVMHLASLYYQDSDSEEEGTFEPQIHEFVPKVVDSSSKIDYTNYVDLMTNNVSKEYIIDVVHTTPNSGHTISFESESIYLTCILRNSGDKPWPEQFLLNLIETNSGCLNIHKKSELIRSFWNGKQIVAPNEEVELSVEIFNPKLTGTFQYLFTLMTTEGLRFGCPFIFEFTVNNTVSTPYNYPAKPTRGLERLKYKISSVNRYAPPFCFIFLKLINL